MSGRGVGALLALLLVSCSSGSEPKTSASTYTLTGKANLRNAPSSDGSNVVGTLSEGDKIAGVPAEGHDQWIRITDGESRGKFVWIGNLRSATFATQVASKPAAYRSPAGEELFDGPGANRAYGSADEACRGTYPSDPRNGPACAKRDELAQTLKQHDYCLGYSGQDQHDIDEAGWHKCRVEDKVAKSELYAQSIHAYRLKITCLDGSVLYVQTCLSGSNSSRTPGELLVRAEGVTTDYMARLLPVASDLSVYIDVTTPFRAVIQRNGLDARGVVLRVDVLDGEKILQRQEVSDAFGAITVSM